MSSAGELEAAAALLRSPFVERTPLTELASLLLDLGQGAVAPA